MSSKLYDVVAVTGKYQTQNGEEKSRFQRVGAMIEGDRGPYLVLESWFSPAGVAEPGKACFLQLYTPNNQADPAAPEGPDPF